MSAGRTLAAGRPVRVAHLITTLDVGGAETAMSRVVANLDRDRFASLVIGLTSAGPVGARLRESGIEVTSLGMRRGWPSPRGLAALVRRLRAWRPDVLQTWLYHADLLGTVAAPLAGVPRLVWNLRSSDMQWEHYRRLSAWTQRACALASRRPDVVVVNSEAGRAHHAELGYRPARWCVIPNGVDATTFRPDPVARLDVRRELGLDPAAELVGLLARLDPMKDHASFVAAAGQLAEHRAGVHFVLAGPGVHAGASEFAALPESLRGRLHLLGTRSDVPSLMAALDVCALSSISEGFPNVLAEALACGVPCVSTDVGAAREIVGDHGAIVPRADPAALARGLQRVLDLAPDARAALSRSARAHVLARFSLSRCVRAYEAMYGELAQRAVFAQP